MPGLPKTPTLAKLLHLEIVANIGPHTDNTDTDNTDNDNTDNDNTDTDNTDTDNSSSQGGGVGAVDQG